MGMEVVIHLKVKIRITRTIKSQFFRSTVLRSFLTRLLSTPRPSVCLMAGMGTLRSRNQ